jgi:hypothetical protein
MWTERRRGPTRPGDGPEVRRSRRCRGSMNRGCHVGRGRGANIAGANATKPPQAHRRSCGARYAFCGGHAVRRGRAGAWGRVRARLVRPRGTVGRQGQGNAPSRSGIRPEAGGASALCQRTPPCTLGSSAHECGVAGLSRQRAPTRKVHLCTLPGTRRPARRTTSPPPRPRCRHPPSRTARPRSPNRPNPARSRSGGRAARARVCLHSRGTLGRWYDDTN